MKTVLNCLYWNTPPRETGPVQDRTTGQLRTASSLKKRMKRRRKTERGTPVLPGILPETGLSFTPPVPRPQTEETVPAKVLCTPPPLLSAETYKPWYRCGKCKLDFQAASPICPCCLLIGDRIAVPTTRQHVNEVDCYA